MWKTSFFAGAARLCGCGNLCELQILFPQQKETKFFPHSVFPLSTEFLWKTVVERKKTSMLVQTSPRRARCPHRAGAIYRSAEGCISCPVILSNAKDLAPGGRCIFSRALLCPPDAVGILRRLRLLRMTVTGSAIWTQFRILPLKCFPCWW